MSMSSELLQRIKPRILADFKFKQSDDGQWLNQGKCPACGKLSLFTSADNPWVIRCGRESKCGVEYEIKTLYPDEFGNFNKRFQATQTNPNATADAYMHEARGFPLPRIKGFYTQENFYHPKADKGTATVRFTLPQSDSYMERFVEPVEITENDGSKTIRKQNFKGPHRGLWWQPPGMKIETHDTVWITEAVIDSISLYLSGIKSVAILSCSNFPDKRLAEYKGKGVHWVWALDNDKAGKRATQKFAKRMQEQGFDVSAAQAPAKIKKDWNDLYKEQRLTNSDIDTYLYHGSLLIAGDVNEKCALIRQRNKVNFFVTDFNNRLYSFSLDEKDYREALRGLIGESEDSEGDPEAFADTKLQIDATKQAAKISQIANARVEFLYFQRNEVTDESWFYGRIYYPDRRAPMNLAFTPGQVTAPAEFKKRLASAQGAWFSGSIKHLDWIGSRWLSGLKTVQTIDYVGYSKEYDTYLFPNVAVTGGKQFPINSEDYFDLPKLSIKTLARNVPMHIETTQQHYYKDWAELVYQAFGTNGVIAAVFWFASLFAEQTRAKQSSFPFLEIIGEPGSGKTTLVEFLWRLFGRDEEGTDPNKNSFVANQRKMTQYSNMPVVFIEADRDDNSHAKRFDWDEVKPYYNGRGLRARGAKNSGNDTYEPPFRGTLVIEQNAPVNASQAVLERIVQLNFTKSGHNSESKHAVDKMSRLGMEELSYFPILATNNARRIIDYVIDKTPKYQAYLMKDENIEHARLALNHAQLMAFAEQFCLITGLSDDIKKTICSSLYTACIERQVAISRDHPIVEEFWDMFNFLNSRPNDATTCALDHSNDPRLIAVNLNEFVESAGYARQQIPPLIELKRHLKSSKNYKFLDSSKTVASAIKRTATGGSKAVRCWLFELPKGKNKMERVD